MPPPPQFGLSAADYAAHRPPFDPRLFERLRGLGAGLARQRILDIGAGTGLLGRGFSPLCANIVECDPSLDLLRLADGPAKVACIAESLPFADRTFDLVTAGQSWHWFDRRRAPVEIRRVLKSGGLVAAVYQTYLPMEGNIAQATEELILRYRPRWRHAGGVGVNGQVLRDLQSAGFVGIESFTFDTAIAFTRDSWRGYMRTCSAMGPSLGRDGHGLEALSRFDEEHARLLENQPEPLIIPHRVFAAIARCP